jgi:DNA-binding transcriptional LysR family regulator
VRLVASTAYLRTHGLPRTPQELVTHQLLGASDPEGRLEWQLQRGQERVVVQAQPHVSVLDPDTRAALVAAHLGISWLPAFLCQDGIDRGELVVVLPDWEPQWVRLHAFLPTAHSRNVKAKAMIDFLVEQLGSEADQASYRLVS